MSAEELKEAVRQYAEEHFPSWKACRVTIRTGGVFENDDETLLLLAAGPSHPPPREPEGGPETFSGSPSPRA